MKSTFKKPGSKLHDPRFESFLILVLPCLALFIAGVIVLPRLLSVLGAGAVVRNSAPDETTAVVSAQPQTPPETEAKQFISDAATTRPVISAVPGEDDMYVSISDGQGNDLTGYAFEFSLVYPDGSAHTYKTTTDGGVYISGLPEGDYLLTMTGQIGLPPAADTPVEVKAKPAVQVQPSAQAVEYRPIADIDKYLEVFDNTEIAQTEVKTVTNEAPEITPEIILTPVEALNPDSVNIVTELRPVLDASGAQLYTYEFMLSQSGYLLYSDGGESDIIPVDENNDGLPEYGLRKVNDGQNGEYFYTTVELYNADNTPDATFLFAATPVTEETVSAVLIGWQNIDGKDYYYDVYGNPVVGLKNIDGRLYYFNQYGVKAKSIGVDVSFYNNGINWNAVKAQGVDFAIIRVGGRGWESGKLYDDVCFLQNLREARAAGLRVGVYFYTTAVDALEAVQEASLVVERLNGAALDMPVYIDMEFSGDYPRGRSDTLSIIQRTDIINAFCQTIINAGYRAGVYSGQYFFQHYLDYTTMSKYSVWMASYTSANKVPDFAGRYDIWQFTDSGRINGISGGVDLNVMY